MRAPARSSARSASSRRAPAARRPTRRSRRSSASPRRSSRRASARSPAPRSRALDELWTVSGSGGGDQVALIDTIEDESAPDPQGTLSVTEQKEALAEAIQRLPEREKLVVTLYYYEELTLREIGEVLGVTESRVSQLHTKAILRLKAHIASAGGSAAA